MARWQTTHCCRFRRYAAGAGNRAAAGGQCRFSAASEALLSRAVRAGNRQPDVFNSAGTKERNNPSARLFDHVADEQPTNRAVRRHQAKAQLRHLLRAIGRQTGAGAGNASNIEAGTLIVVSANGAASACKLRGVVTGLDHRYFRHPSPPRVGTICDRAEDRAGTDMRCWGIPPRCTSAIEHYLPWRFVDDFRVCRRPPWLIMARWHMLPETGA